MKVSERSLVPSALGLPRWMMAKIVLGVVMCGMLWTAAAASLDAAVPQRGLSSFSHNHSWSIHFVPNSQSFWDFSKNWTTNYGPAYRDTVLEPSNFLPCEGQFALCFHSGPEPLPCKLTHDGRFANCTCDVMDGENYVLETAILNYPVYRATIDACQDEDCQVPNTAPVCKFLTNGKLIPGAQVISTYDPELTTNIRNEITAPTGLLKNCDGPFAGCMTAPCQPNKDGATAQCLCPVFWGHFQLVGEDAECELGDDLVPSASYNPYLDPSVP